MRNFVVLCLLLIVSNYAYPQSWISSNTIRGSENITIIHSTAGSDNSTLVMGHFIGTIEANPDFEVTSYGGRDYFIAKFNNSNEVAWIINFGSVGTDYILGGISVDNEGNVFVTGGFQGSLFYTPTNSIESTGNFDIFLAKIDPDGNVLWCNNIGMGFRNQRPNSLKVDTQGDLLLSGFFSDSIKFDDTYTLYSDNSVDDYFYSKFSSADGSLMWSRQIKAYNNVQSGRIFEISTTAESYTFVGMYSDSISFDSEDTIVSQNNSVDIHIINTDLTGNINWIRSIQGDANEYIYATQTDPNNNIYLAGYYESESLTFDISADETTTLIGNAGSSDIFIAKYTNTGNFEWIKTNGGAGTDKLFSIDFYDDELHVTGLFSENIQWGGIELTTTGVNDQDMFYGSVSLNGNYRNANNYGGRNNSTEEGRSIFADANRLSTVIRSNSDLLVLGDSLYTNPSFNYFVAVGTISCLPINVNSSEFDVNGCYGDKNGTIFIGASGGFGGPYRYSIDNGDTYQDNDPNFASLGAGTYPTVVLDNANCAQAGPEVIIDQPDSLIITTVVSDSAKCFGGDGSITIETAGGTGNVFFSTDGGTSYLYPVGTATNFPEGTYSISVSDANDCITDLDSSVIIDQPDELTLTLVSSSDITDDANGEIVVSASGGTGNLTYTINPSSGTQGPDSVFTFVAGEGGNYVVEVDDANNCGPVSTSSITIADLTNISNLDIVNASIYPNPSSGMVTVEFNTDKAEMTMEVFSIDGRNVMSRQVYSAGGQVKEVLDLSSLDKGMYMIRVDQQTLSSAVVLN